MFVKGVSVYFGVIIIICILYFGVVECVICLLFYLIIFVFVIYSLIEGSVEGF